MDNIIRKPILIHGPNREITVLLDSLTATVPQLSAVIRSIRREGASTRSVRGAIVLFNADSTYTIII